MVWHDLTTISKVGTLQLRGVLGDVQVVALLSSSHVAECMTTTTSKEGNDIEANWRVRSEAWVQVPVFYCARVLRPDACPHAFYRYSRVSCKAEALLGSAPSPQVGATVSFSCIQSPLQSFTSHS